MAVKPDFFKRIPAPGPQGGLWPGETQSLIDQGLIVPCISNYLMPRVFGPDTDAAAIASSWAAELGSPLSEDQNRTLARVAQFYSVHVSEQREDARKARLEYHNVLKGFLLAFAKSQPDFDVDFLSSIEGRPDQLERMTFSEMARDLGFPKYADVTDNPMRLLAELPLKMYLTTSQHTFLEDALRQTGFKQPEIEILYWEDAQQVIRSVFEDKPDYEPSVERPLVYHLFGVDKYPNSMVLTEDDYVTVLMRLSQLKFQVKVSTPGGGGGSKFDIPSEIKTALSGAGLLLLGYDVESWEFRVLFSWLVDYIGSSRTGRSSTPEAFCLQVRSGGAGRIEDYLRKFFKLNHFTVYWSDPESCVRELWSRWKGL